MQNSMPEATIPGKPLCPESLMMSYGYQPEERIAIYNTGSGLKYLEAYSARFPR